MATTSISRHHAEWLGLLDTSGPFLSLPVLARAFPQGLDTLDSDRRARLRQAYDEWQAALVRQSPSHHQAWFTFVLREALGIERGDLRRDQDLPPNLAIPGPMGPSGPIRPTAAVVDPAGAPRLLIDLAAPGQALDRHPSGRPLEASPAERMRMLLRGTGLRVGLVTNGEDWMLVDAPPGELASYANFPADLWFEEPLVLRAFVSLLSLRRLCGVADDDTLPALLGASARDQHEITDQLGRQVRAAVEVLIQTIDRIDRDRKRALLAGIDEARLYRGAVTVMMRLVFLFTAEERGLLPRQLPLYTEHYAASTLRDQLEDLASRHGEELLGRRYGAWCRILALTRAIHGGVAHHELHLPAYGSSLFDPDAYPFLEGRRLDPERPRRWVDEPADPLPIDDRTVLDLLRALQLLQVRLPGGGVETRRLSFSGLGVEDIGHVYEGLLDHTAVRASAPVIGLAGAKGIDPEVALDELEAREGDPKALVDYLEAATGRARKTLEKAVAAPYAATFDDRRTLSIACDNDDPLIARVERWTPLLRRDAHEVPVVFPPRSLYVTKGAERRQTGTHYTRPDLSAEIVRHTLEPLCFDGPAEGLPRERWVLRPARALLGLKICDVAMGSGAFLVQACRYLGDRLCDAWTEAEASHPGQIVTTPEGELSAGDPRESILPVDPRERTIYARRLVADRCLYGVDKNPMAVEMAKLSLWLETFHRERPFSFLDHALIPGDSLLGLASAERPFEQVDIGRLYAPFERAGREALAEAVAIRRRLAAIPADHITQVEHKNALKLEAERALADIAAFADVITTSLLTAVRLGRSRDERPDMSDTVSAVVTSPSAEGKLGEVLAKLYSVTDEKAPLRARAEFFGELREIARRQASYGPDGSKREPFHWPLAFPEVFFREGSAGFDAIVGNPPYQGGQRITGALGTDYRQYLVEHLARGQRGSADLSAYFFLRAAALLREPGQMGLVATNTIAQGDTREVGLDQLVVGTEGSMELFRAISSEPWLGDASLEVSYVWLRKGAWAGERVLDGEVVEGITAALGKPGKVEGKPYRLKANEGKSFQGSNVLGKGFVMTPEEAAGLIAQDPRNGDVLFPYLNREDLNSTVDQSPTRWVINFRDWPLDRGSAPEGYEGPVAADYPGVLEIVVERVKPQRDALGDGNATARDRARRWWQFARPTLALYRSLYQLEHCIATAEVSKHICFGIEPTDLVFSHTMIIVASSSTADLADLQSSIHDVWAREYSSSLETRLRYTPTDCLETFPFPANFTPLDSIGARYESHRRAVMQATQRGLTKTYNRFHDPADQDPGIAQLRRLHVEMDRAVADAYGWQDLDLQHGFHETKQGLRYTISERARREVLDRLLALNHRRYAEEVAAGLHAKKSSGRRASARRAGADAAAGAARAAAAPASAGPEKPKRRGKAPAGDAASSTSPSSAPASASLTPPPGTTLDLFGQLSAPPPGPAEPAAAPARPAATRRSAPASPQRADPPAPPAPPPNPTPEPQEHEPPASAAPTFEAACDAILAALAAADGPLSADELLEAAGLPDFLWPKLRAHLVKKTGQVVTEGKARGTRYRLP